MLGAVFIRGTTGIPDAFLKFSCEVISALMKICDPVARPFPQ